MIEFFFQNPTLLSCMLGNLEWKIQNNIYFLNVPAPF